MRTVKILFICSMLFVYPFLNIFAQDVNSISPPSSPSDITPSQNLPQTLTNTQDAEQVQAIENAVSASGESINRDQLRTIQNNPQLLKSIQQNNPQLQNLEPQTIESLKTKYENKNTQSEITQTDTDTSLESHQEKKPGTEEETPSEKKPETEEETLPDEENDPNIITKKSTQPIIAESSVFGMSFFLPARNRITALEGILKTGNLPSSQKFDALSGFVGPLDMVSSNVNATIPEKYRLSGGDRIIIYFWADSIALTTYKLKIDNTGNLSIPQLGPLTVRGMTITQLQDSLKKQLERVLGKKEINLIATLETLKSMQISITGEAFRPGSYAVSAVTTLFNALQACGGPNKHGSLRDIKLLRNGTMIAIDFYDFLLNGDKTKDYPLFEGDTVFIPKSGKVVKIKGEVNRPADYELKANEHLLSIITFANGNKPTAFTEKIQIKTIKPNKERIILDVNLENKELASKIHLFDGDIVTIPPISSKIVNMVTLSGAVERPGRYELKKNMRVADLFSKSNRPLGDAVLNRADLIRYNPDGVTTTLIPINLQKALLKTNKHNITLASRDTIRVYSKWEMAYYPKREVRIVGSVQRPGIYGRSDNMTISDLLIKAGGVLPDTSLERADLIRYNPDGVTTSLIPISLQKVLSKDSNQNMELAPRDTIRVYSKWEMAYYPKREIRIIGSVQRPGTYKRRDNMTISDLLVKAGGILPDTNTEKAILLRYDLMTNQYSSTTLNLEDPLLKTKQLMDMDELYIFSIKDIKYIPIHEVTVMGAVQRPGHYKKTKDMKLSDLLYLSGGVLPGFHNKIEIAKARNDQKTKSIIIEISDEGTVINDIPLEDGDIVMVRKKSEYFEKPIWVEISGEVKYPGRYPLSGKNERLSSIINRAGGMTDYAHPKGMVFKRKKAYINSGPQQELLSSVNEITNRLNELNFQRQTLRNQWLLLEAKNSGDKESIDAFPSSSSLISNSDDPAEAAAIGMSPQIASSTGQAVQRFTSAADTGPGVTAKARKFLASDLAPPEMQRLIFSLEDAIKNQNSNYDPILMPGDTIHIPLKHETVSVVGALMYPSLIKYNPDKKGRRPKYYIKRAGGFAEDANTKKVLIARVDGSIMHIDKIKKIEPGDIIYVPPKVVSLEIVSKTDKIIDAVKFSLVVASSLAAFITLVGMF